MCLNICMAKTEVKRLNKHYRNNETLGIDTRCICSLFQNFPVPFDLRMEMALNLPFPHFPKILLVEKICFDEYKFPSEENSLGNLFCVSRRPLLTGNFIKSYKINYL